MSKDLGMELGRKKTVHIEMPKSIHTRMRVKLIEQELSIQSVFQEVAERISIGDPYMMRLLDFVQEKRLNKRVASISETDAESLFSILEKHSPLSDVQE